MNGNKRFDWFTAVIVLGLFMLYVFGILGHDLWTPDEPRVAALGRQVAEGAWVVPTLNGQPFLEQPPLHAWCVALTYKVFGYDPPEIGRIVSALFGLGGLIVTYLMASHLARFLGHDGSPRRVGLLAALTLGLSFEYFLTAHRVVVDGALTFFTTLSAYALLYGLPAEPSGSRTAWLAAGYALASVAFLAKGLIGVAVPALAFIALVIVLRRPRLLLTSHLWLAPILFVVVTGPWFGLVYCETGWQGLWQVFQEIFVENTLGRIVRMEEVRSHARPLHYYLILLLPVLLPAALFVLGAAIRRIRRAALLPLAERTAYDLAFVWFALGFILLSLATTKRAVYLVPLFPALAIAGGFWLEAYLRRAADGLYEKTLGHLLAILVLIAAAALPVSAIFLEEPYVPGLILGAIVGAGIAVETWILTRRGIRPGVLTSAVNGIVLVFIFAVAMVVPPVDAFKALGPSSRRIAEAVPAGAEIHALNPDETTEGMIPFYVGRTIRPLEDAKEFEDRLRQVKELYLLDVSKRWIEGTPYWASWRYIEVDAGPDVLILDVPGTKSPRRIEGCRSEVVLLDAGRGPGSRAFRVLKLTLSGS